MQLVRAQGVKLKINSVFIALFPIYYALGVLPQGLIAFGLVLLHEIAHSLTAVAHGMRLVEIEIMPFGGVAKLEGPLEAEPSVEIKVALAGPAFNLLFAVFIYLTLVKMDVLTQMVESALGAPITVVNTELPLLGLSLIELSSHPLTFYLLQANLLLAGFNLLPALPLDGGRVYRAFISRWWGFHRATRHAARGGEYFAVALGLMGLFGLAFHYTDGFLLVLALFLFYAARKEKREVMYHFMGQLMRKKEELPQKGALPVRTVALQANTPLKEAVRQVLPNRWHLFLVVNREGELMGTLTETKIIGEFLRGDIERPLGDLLPGDKP